MRRVAIVVLSLALGPVSSAQRPLISTSPETPFTLATFEAAGKTRVGIVLGQRILDIEGAHTAVVQELARRGMPPIPPHLRALIEGSGPAPPQLHPVCNRLKG